MDAICNAKIVWWASSLSPSKTNIWWRTTPITFTSILYLPNFTSTLTRYEYNMKNRLLNGIKMYTMTVNSIIFGTSDESVDFHFTCGMWEISCNKYSTWKIPKRNAQTVGKAWTWAGEVFTATPPRVTLSLPLLLVDPRLKGNKDKSTQNVSSNQPKNA